MLRETSLLLEDFTKCLWNSYIQSLKHTDSICSAPEQAKLNKSLAFKFFGLKILWERGGKKKKKKGIYGSSVLFAHRARRMQARQVKNL